jgi:hypothetical protein
LAVKLFVLAQKLALTRHRIRAHHACFLGGVIDIVL